MSKRYAWSDEKNETLQRERNISFEAVVNSMRSGGLLDIYKHPNNERYPNQNLAEVVIQDYIWIVAFVETEEEIFLKTAFPSRKATKKHKE